MFHSHSLKRMLKMFGHETKMKKEHRSAPFCLVKIRNKITLRRLSLIFVWPEFIWCLVRMHGVGPRSGMYVFKSLFALLVEEGICFSSNLDPIFKCDHRIGFITDFVTVLTLAHLVTPFTHNWVHLLYIKIKKSEMIYLTIVINN